MTRQAFDEFIEKTSIRNRNSTVNWDEQREEWLTHLRHFYNMVEEFTEDYVARQQLAITRSREDLNEENIGKYKVDILSISIGSTEVTLIPIGTLLIGSKGRVDMVGPKGKVKFVLVPKGSVGPRIIVRAVDPDSPFETGVAESIKEWEWRIMTSPPQISYLPLDADAFYSALLEVING